MKTYSTFCEKAGDAFKKMSDSDFKRWQEGNPGGAEKAAKIRGGADPLADAAPNVKKIAPATKASAQQDKLKSATKALPPSSSSTSKPGALVTSPKTQMVKRNTGTSAKKVDDRIKSQQAKPNTRTRVPDKTYPSTKPPQKKRFSDKVDKKIGNAAKKAGSKLGDGLKKAPGAALRGAGKIGKAVVGAKSSSLGASEGKNIGRSATREYGDSQY